MVSSKVAELAEKTKQLSPAGQEIVGMAAAGEFTGANGQSLSVRLASKDDMLQAIRNANADIARARAEEKAAKEMLNEEIEQLDGWIDHESAKEEVKRTKDELEAQKLESAAVETAAENHEDKKSELASKRALLSDLLVLYAAKYNSKTVEVEREQPRLIILSAKVGKVEPEQLALF